MCVERITVVFLRDEISSNTRPGQSIFFVTRDTKMLNCVIISITIIVAEDSLFDLSRIQRQCTAIIVTFKCQC